MDECKKKNGGCNQICVNKPGTFECTCKVGYKLGTNKKTCSGNIFVWNGNDDVSNYSFCEMYGVHWDNVAGKLRFFSSMLKVKYKNCIKVNVFEKLFISVFEVLLQITTILSQRIS